MRMRECKISKPRRAPSHNAPLTSSPRSITVLFIGAGQFT